MLNNPIKAIKEINNRLKLNLYPENNKAKIIKKVTNPLCPPDISIKTTRRSSKNFEKLDFRYCMKKKYPDGTNTMKKEEKV
ncbi:hypothetical protein [Allomuricauda sp. CP2A]|jgi:hypothetical protein|uniref:hypothetical protein n=1 Tax=Allomuricauda sp. CP2A TaxID=1848189 RepID=UPI001146F714|nr:hypothetical protein [Muricauda sp. CP2A]